MPHGRRWRGGRGREAQPIPIRGFVEPALLLLLRAAPAHGYELLRGLEELGFDRYPVDPSTVYRTLGLLEAEGLVTSGWEAEASLGPPRRVYRITAAGAERLAAWVNELRATDRILHRFFERVDGSDERDKTQGP